MADGVYKLPSGKFRAHVHRKGHGQITKVFKFQSDAIRWKAEQDRSITNTGMPLTIDQLKPLTVGYLVQRYLKEVTPTKGSRISEASVLNKFLKQDMCSMSLAYPDQLRQAAIEYRNFRLYKDSFHGKPISPSAFKRQLVTLRHMFNLAKDEWGLTNLSNPFSRIKIPGAQHKRRRRLEAGELERIEQACLDCKGLNVFYIPLAVYLAIETGMRLQEIFNLTYNDVDIVKRRIEIRKSKTDHLREYAGRTIVLTARAMSVMSELGIITLTLHPGVTDIRSRYIFPRTTKGQDPRGAFKQAWADVLKRAGIEDLHFHDLRREAGSRFHLAGLTGPEQDLMMGHANESMRGLYIDTPLNIIQDKLDRFQLGGMTLKEFMEARKKEQAEGLPLLSKDEALAMVRRNNGQ